MATATATIHLNPYHANDGKNNVENNRRPHNDGSESPIGLAISPNPSPHTTLTPAEAAVLSAQAKAACAIHVGAEGSINNEHPNVDSATLHPSDSYQVGNYLSHGTMGMNCVSRDVSTDAIPSNDSPTAANDDANGDAMNSSNSEAEANTREKKLEERIEQLEKTVASLVAVCNSIIGQEYPPPEHSSPIAPTSPQHGRFDAETEMLSRWPPVQQPVLDSPEVSWRRYRRKSSSHSNRHPKPSKTMSMVLLDIAAGENRGPSMIPFTDDLDADGEIESSSEEAKCDEMKQVGSSSDVSQTSRKERSGGRSLVYGLPTAPNLGEVEDRPSHVRNESETSSDDSETSSPENSSNEFPILPLGGQHLRSSLKSDVGSNLECQAYTADHLEALRLRREAGKVRAYSCNDSFARIPEPSRSKNVNEGLPNKTEAELPLMSSPIQMSPTLITVLQTDERQNEPIESVDNPARFEKASSDEVDNELVSPVSLFTNGADEKLKSPMVSIPRKESIASQVSAKSYHSHEHKSLADKPSPIEIKGGDHLVSTLRHSSNSLTKRERARSIVSEKDDTSFIAKKGDSTEVKSSSEHVTDTKSKQTMKEYIMNDLLNIDSRHQDGSATEDIDANMEEFLRIPFKLEKLMIFALAVCVDSFLYVWTMLPLKVIWGFVCLLSTMLRPGKGIRGIMFDRRHLYALLQCLLVWFVYYHVLRPISIGKLYRWIRGQAMIKLYVLIAIVEVFDRLLCSFGQDAWDSLYWNTTRRPKHPRMLVSMIVVAVYVTIHSLFLFVHVATLSVAVNSADNALLTLLISGNFAEIKSSVFKKYNKQNLFKITTSDICERFKLALFLLLILLLNCFQGEMSRSMVIDYYTMCLIVMVAEFISDWIKHSFITKFNFIKSSAYFDYALVLSGDVTGIGHEGLNLDYTHAAVKRLGLAQIPLVCVTARYFHEAVRFAIAFRGNGDVEHQITPWSLYFGLFCFMIVLVGLKIILGVFIRIIARRNLGGDVAEMLVERRKTSSTRSSTPKTSKSIIQSAREEQKEGKKNQ